MSNNPQVTKKQLLKIIDELEKKPHDKIRILGDAGITIVGMGLGAAAAGTLASAAGATSIWGLTTVAGWLGVTTVAATPVGWVIGTAAAGGAAAYFISRMIHGGGLSEGRKKELLEEYKKSLSIIAAKENTGQITDTDRTNFIISIREIIDKNVVSPDEALKLIEEVEKGHIPLSQAFELIKSLLEENIP